MHLERSSAKWRPFCSGRTTHSIQVRFELRGPQSDAKARSFKGEQHLGITFEIGFILLYIQIINARTMKHIGVSRCLPWVCPVFICSLSLFHIDFNYKTVTLVLMIIERWYMPYVISKDGDILSETVCLDIFPAQWSPLSISFIRLRLTETETSLFNTKWHYTDAWYQTYMTVLMYYSVITWYRILACMLGDLC